MGGSNSSDRADNSAHSEDNRNHRDSECVVGTVAKSKKQRGVGQHGWLTRTYPCPSIPCNPVERSCDPPVYVVGDLFTPKVAYLSLSHASKKKRKRIKRRIRRSTSVFTLHSSSSGPNSTSSDPSSNSNGSSPGASAGVAGGDGGASAGGDGGDDGDSAILNSVQVASGVAPTERAYEKKEYIWNINKSILTNSSSHWKKQLEYKIEPSFKLVITVSLHPCITNGNDKYITQMKISAVMVKNRFPEFIYRANVSTELVSPDSKEVFGWRENTYDFIENVDFNVFMELAAQEDIQKTKYKELKLKVSLQLIQEIQEMKYKCKDAEDFDDFINIIKAE